jgi:hypothetical protein
MTLETDVDKFISTICKTPASLQNENNFYPGVKSNHAYDKHTFRCWPAYALEILR